MRTSAYGWSVVRSNWSVVVVRSSDNRKHAYAYILRHTPYTQNTSQWIRPTECLLRLIRITYGLYLYYLALVLNGRLKCVKTHIDSHTHTTAPRWGKWNRVDVRVDGEYGQEIVSHSCALLWARANRYFCKFNWYRNYYIWHVCFAHFTPRAYTHTPIRLMNVFTETSKHSTSHASYKSHNVRPYFRTYISTFEREKQNFRS